MALIPSFFGGGRRSNVFDPFSLDIWDPFEGFPIGGAVANIPSSAAKDASALANVRIDWRETPDAHIIKADLPGLDKGEVRVEIEDDGRILLISGERSREQEEQNDKWHRVERSVGRFVRRFRLPENAKTDQVEARMENGVLTVVIPKEKERRPESRPIQISGGEGEGGRVSTGGEVGVGGGTTGQGLSGGATGGDGATGGGGSLTVGPRVGPLEEGFWTVESVGDGCRVIRGDGYRGNPQKVVFCGCFCCCCCAVCFGVEKFVLYLVNHKCMKYVVHILV